jgi:hypothetical protein
MRAVSTSGKCAEGKLVISVDLQRLTTLIDWIHQEPFGGTSGGTTASDVKYLSGNIASVRVSKASGRNSMVECQLPKLKVASSSLVARSKFPQKYSNSIFKS